MATNLLISLYIQSKSKYVNTENIAIIFGFSVPIAFEQMTPQSIPNRSMTAICASPFAVISPILSDPRENDLYLHIDKR